MKRLEIRAQIARLHTQLETKKRRMRSGKAPQPIPPEEHNDQRVTELLEAEMKRVETRATVQKLRQDKARLSQRVWESTSISRQARAAAREVRAQTKKAEAAKCTADDLETKGSHSWAFCEHSTSLDAILFRRST